MLPARGQHAGRVAYRCSIIPIPKANGGDRRNGRLSIHPYAFFQHDVRVFLDEQIDLRESSKIELPRNRREGEYDIKAVVTRPTTAVFCR